MRDFLKDDVIKEMVKIGHDQEGNDFFEWNLYHDQVFFGKVVKKLVKKIKDPDEIDYVASLGGSGCPLATRLSQEIGKKLLFVHDRWAITETFRPLRPFDVDISGKTILLVDSILRTGLTAYNGMRVIKTKGGIPFIAVMVILNEWVDLDLLSGELGDVETYYLLLWNKRIFDIAVEQQLI